MDADQGSNGKPCVVDQGPGSIAAERKSALSGDDTMAISSDLLCCMCRQLVDEPVLLKCLHSCCKRCLKIASPVHESSEVKPSTVENSNVAEVFGMSCSLAFVFHQLSQSSLSVCCQTCMETTRVAEAVDNAFLAGKVRVLKIRRNMATCTFCSGDEKGACAARNASFWCGTCQSTLCADCVTGLHRKFHKTHSTTSLHEMQCGDQVIGASSASCVKHGRPYELACFTCEMAKCVSCAADCMAARHDMLLLSDPRFACRFTALKLRVAELASSVSSKSAVLQQHVDMVELLSAARQADLDQLKANKRLVMDAIDQAYLEAEVALKDGYDELEEKALTLRDAAEQKLERVRNAVDYAQQLLDADGEIVALMQQQELIVSRLDALVKILDGIPSARDASAFFAVPKCTESTATPLVNSCLPKPQLKFDELCIVVSHQKKSCQRFDFTPLRAPPVPKHPQTCPLPLTTQSPEAKAPPLPPAKLSTPEPAVANPIAAISNPASTTDSATAIGASIDTWQGHFRSMTSGSGLETGVPQGTSGVKNLSSSGVRHCKHCKKDKCKK